MNSTTTSERRSAYVEPAMAIIAFIGFCVIVLTVAPLLLGPDGEAYRASIVAITDGHFLSLSASQAHALVVQLYRCPRSATTCLIPGPAGPLGRVPEQWVKLPDGRWISEKNPGYPFLAAPFQALGIIRLAPLCYGALASLGLYAGARRWLGSPAGAIAVGLFCSCDVAMVLAWQDYWSAFTDAALVAAGTGTLLWAALADDVADRRRTLLGLLGFLAIESAVFARYTNIVVLACAALAVAALQRLRPGSLPRAALRCWLSSAALFAAGAAAFDAVVYGAPLDTGYRPGEVTFSLGAVAANLWYMPPRLVQAMPVFLLGLAALGLIVARRVRLGRADNAEGRAEGHAAGRDFVVGIALGAPWLALWALYASYAWTARAGIGTWQSSRFYLAAAGPVALLASWPLVRLSRTARRQGLLPAWRAAVPAAAVVLALFALATWTFRDQADRAVPAIPGAPPPACNIGEPHCPVTPPPAAGLTGQRLVDHGVVVDQEVARAAQYRVGPVWRRIFDQPGID